MHVGIDAVNISFGGGLHHLIRALDELCPEDSGIKAVTVITGHNTADYIPKKSWLKVCRVPLVCRYLVFRIIYQQLVLPVKIRGFHFDVLFSPGGVLPRCSSVPTVVMSQNMLPFESLESLSFGRWSLMRLKMHMLRMAQGRSFKDACGLIFLTSYAQNVINEALGEIHCQQALVPHGVENRFRQSPRRQRAFFEYTDENPFKVLYVSILMPYKHQIEVAQAIELLRRQGVPVEVVFVGASWGKYGTSFQRFIRELDPDGHYIKYQGHVPFEELHLHYQDSDVFLFASSCENLPNILIEAMASGLPIACSNRGPMPEVLGDAGIYFDPTSSPSIAESLLSLSEDPLLRGRLASAAWQMAQAYSWERCAYETFNFIADVARKYRERALV